LAVYGTGGHGREIAALIQSGRTNQPDDFFLGFIDDNPDNHSTTINRSRVYSLDQVAREFHSVKIICGVGSPRIRQTLADKCAARGLSFATVISAGSCLSPDIEIGEGSVVAAGAILTTNIRLGRHVHLNIGCTVSHDVVIDDFAIVNPGARINGWVHLGRRCYIGAGAVIINGDPGHLLTVGADAVVGAGACVIRPVPAGTTVVGVPAHPIG